MGLSSSQNLLIQPTVGPDVSDTVSTEQLPGLGEIGAEDTDNIIVQVLNMIILHSLNNLVLCYFCCRC